MYQEGEVFMHHSKRSRIVVWLMIVLMAFTVFAKTTVPSGALELKEIQSDTEEILKELRSDGVYVKNDGNGGFAVGYDKEYLALLDNETLRKELNANVNIVGGKVVLPGQISVNGTGDSLDEKCTTKAQAVSFIKKKIVNRATEFTMFTSVEYDVDDLLEAAEKYSDSCSGKEGDAIMKAWRNWSAKWKRWYNTGTGATLGYEYTITSE